MNIAALLTAKGKSTFQNKNIFLIKNNPVLYYPATAALRSKYIEEFYVSSDSEIILQIAHDFGYKKILRPAELAQPDSRHIDAITHALDWMRERDNFEPDILVVLLGNNVTTKTEWIDEGIVYILKDKSISSVVPVLNDQDYHPFRAKTLNTDGFLDTFFDFTGKQISTNRQELPPCFYLCHNFWILNVKESVYKEGGQQPWVFMGNKIKPIIVDECFDVHDEDDISRCEKWLERNQ
jgi:CMP-N,N'-diacetyllegionaminic acid synthase